MTRSTIVVARDRRAALLSLAWLALAPVAACTHAAPRAEPEPGLTLLDDPMRGGASDTDDAAPTILSAADADADAAPQAAPGARSFHATLPATLPVSYGGAPYCAYRSTLEHVTVDLTQAKNGDVVAASVTALAVEETVPPCPYPPLAASTHHYALRSSTLLPGGARHVELVAATANVPIVSLTLEGNLDEAFPELTLVWHRIDIDAPFDWSVTARVTLATR